MQILGEGEIMVEYTTGRYGSESRKASQFTAN